MSDEEKVVHLLASLPDSFNMLVMALEANSESVPKMENVTERLMHEEKKLKERAVEDDERRAFAVKGIPREDFVCHYCKKPGHIKRNCRKLAAKYDKPFRSANKATRREQQSSDEEAMMISHDLSATPRGDWIIDSRVTCHMCHDKKLFSELKSLSKPREVILGDGHMLEASAVSLQMLLPDGNTKRCNLKDVLLVPKLSHNLLSVSKASELGKNYQGQQLWMRNSQSRRKGYSVCN